MIIFNWVLRSECFSEKLLINTIETKAQFNIEGDLDRDGMLSVKDVTKLVNVIVEKDQLFTPESLIAGTWRTKKGDTITLNADGTTKYEGTSTFKFKNTDKLLYFYNRDGKVVRLYNVIEANYAFLILNLVGEENEEVYYNSRLFVNSVKLSNDNIKLTIQDTIQLTAKCLPTTAINNSLKWCSSDSTIAKVDQNGEIVALSKGSVTISVSTSEGITASANCSVEEISGTDGSNLNEGENYFEAFTNAHGVFIAKQNCKVLIETQEVFTVEHNGKKMEYSYVSGSQMLYKYEVNEVKVNDVITISSDFVWNSPSKIKITLY